MVDLQHVLKKFIKSLKKVNHNQYKSALVKDKAIRFIGHKTYKFIYKYPNLYTFLTFSC